MNSDIFQLIILPFLTFVSGVVYSSIKSDRLGKGQLLSDQLELLHELRDLSVQYWASDRSSINNALFEVKIRGKIHEMSSRYDDILWILGLDRFHTSYAPAFMNLFEKITGGDFEMSTRTPNPGRAIESITATTDLRRVIELRKREIEGVNPFKWYRKS